MSTIEHVVVIVKENHTYDNYFGSLQLPGADPDPRFARAPNPPASDHPHDHAAWLQRDIKAVKQEYHESDLPHYFAYARAYTICNRYNTEVAGPSTPNHLMLIAADSPIINNPHQGDPLQPPFDIPSLPVKLDAARVTWKNYGGYVFDYISGLVGHASNLRHGSAQFALDAAAGTLPAVSWVYAPTGLSEHPVEDISKGEAWTTQQVDAVVRGGLWPTTAIFITWDDWGGWADTGPAPLIEAWSGGGTFRGTQFRYGSRVPCLVLSPYAKRGINSTQHSHLSITRFIEERFGVSAINARDAAATSMAGCFDLTQQPLPAPPGPQSPASKAQPRM